LSLTCEHTKGDGRPCRANARAGSRFCFFHDPAAAEQRAAARRRGGQARSRRAAVLPPGTQDLPLSQVGDVGVLLALTINQTRRGELDPKVANAVGYLASVQLKALSESDLARKVDQLQEMVERVERDHSGNSPACRTTGAEGPAAGADEQSPAGPTAKRPGEPPAPGGDGARPVADESSLLEFYSDAPSLQPPVRQVPDGRRPGGQGGTP
jgi:hypothetical protein